MVLKFLQFLKLRGKVKDAPEENDTGLLWFQCGQKGQTWVCSGKLMFEDAVHKGFPVERLQIFNALAQAGVQNR